MSEDPSPKRGIRWAIVGWTALNVVGVLAMLGAVALVVAPLFIHTDTYGQHDWDPTEAHRYLAVKTLKVFHQFPFWDPYTCGGHTWWGGMESGTVVSPWLPIYLLASLTWAIRLEIIGATLLSSVGTWFFAGRFTKSPGLRLIAVAAFAINGRFGEQVGVGHAWHLYYAWTPWALFFLDRAIAMAPKPWTSAKRIERGPLRDVILLGAMLAMMVYTGGIYPLPHTICAIACYSIYAAIASRSLRPIGYAIGGGALSFAFAAPRLLPILDMLRRFPRLVDSPESMDLAGLVGVFTAKEAGVHPMVSPWGWHEFGIYTGWIPFLLMLFALLFAARARERALRVAGGFCLLLGFGRFHEWSPWALMHDHVPIFESQHVPSRWLYPAALLLVVAASGVIERFLARQARRGWLEVALLSLGAYVAADVALEAQRPLVGAFVRKLPAITDSPTTFHVEKTAPANLRFDVSDWAPTSLGPMMANIGTVDCSTFPGLHSYYRDRDGRTPGLGARGVGDPEYRGEVYITSRRGIAEVTSWTPNAVTVAVRGATIGDTLVLNQNWDPGWRANGESVIDYRSAVATTLEETDGEITFRYVPRFLFLGCVIFILTIAGLIWVPRVMARGARVAGSAQ